VKPSARAAARPWAVLCAFAAVAAGLLPAGGAHAGPVAVSPVSVKLEPGTDFGNLRVGNPGASQTGVEIDVVRVRLEAGREVYEPASEFVVSPPSFMLQPGDNRMMRFRFTGRRSAQEGIYRIFVRQLPDRSSGAINFAVNIGVPVFVAPTTALPALVIDPTPEGARLRNSGNVTVTVREIDGCAQPLKVAARLFPQQTVALADGDIACLQTAQSDRGPISLTAARR
jgi:fimbrial chaperone protein